MLIQNFIKKIKQNQSILIAYSGGVDSTVLLHQLIPFTKKFPFLKLRAIHINHTINIHSNLWSQHCQKVCKENNIPFILKKIFFKNKKNLQAQARKIRYKIIFQNILPNEISVTAHHLNDQCETFFLNLKRGSSNAGLSGIAYIKYFKNKKIFRPLITYTKNQLIQWAKLNNISWIEDDSNQKNKYDRNFFRNIILKPIEKKWPFFLHNCYKSMTLCNHQEKILNYFLDNILMKNQLCHSILNTQKIKKYTKDIQILIIKRWILLQTKQILSYKILKEIDKNFFDTNKKKKKYKIQIKKYELRKYKNTIHYFKKYPSLKNTILFWHNTSQTIQLPYNLGQIKKRKYGITLPQPKITDVINIRFQTCKTVFINPNYKKKIKTIWQDNHIPPWCRNRIPIIFYNNIIIAIIGVINFFNYKNLIYHHNTWNISWETKIFNQKN